MDLAAVYRRLPAPLQNAAVTAYGATLIRRRYGPGFRRELRAAEARERFGQADWTTYQLGELNRVLGQARRVPGYSSSRLPEAVTSLEELAQLPRLDKDVLRADPESFCLDGRARRTWHRYSTSGTTGTPLAIWWDDRMNRRLYAHHERRVRRWAGVTMWNSRGMFGGRLVTPGSRPNPPYWRRNFLERQTYFSVYHLGPQTVDAYARAMWRYRPDYLIGYTSALATLGKLFLEAGKSTPSVRSVLVSSDQLTGERRQALADGFGAPVFNSYSMAEAACLISECEQHRLHVSPDVGIVEILDPDGRQTPPGAIGEVVATSLLNHVQPLIRYRTGDFAVVAADQSCPCGRSMPVVEEIVGRQEDQIVTPDGRVQHYFYKVFQGLEGIVQSQVIQHSLDRITIRMVVDEQFGPHIERQLMHNIHERLGDGMQIGIERVSTINRTANGKLRLVISELGDERP